jgi:hypothetical protein
MVLDAIRGHVDRDDWRGPGWSDKEIEDWLEKLVKTIGAGAENPELKLPVRMADVSARDPRGAMREGGLIMGRDLEVPFARKSIIFADGAVKVAHAQDSIIVARSAANVSHATRCLIISGGFVHVSHDGSREGGSVIVSRGWADVSHSHGSYLLAPEGITVSHATNTVFINAGLQSDRGGSKSVKVKLALLGSLTNDPLSKKIEILGIVRPDGAVFRYGGKRYVAEVGQAVMDESAEPVADLKGWRLSHVGDGVAVFANDNRDAIMRHGLQ